MPLPDDILRQLIETARAARQHAYSPYSSFSVGAALLDAEGGVHAGCNVENSSYSVTCCAERTALFAAVAQGVTRFTAIAIAADTDATPPCGVCRQALSEFAPDIDIILTRHDGSFRSVSLTALLPEPFGSDFLK